MKIPDPKEQTDKIWTYENALTEYYSWQKILKREHKGSGCPVCGKAQQGRKRLSLTKEVCESCTEKIQSHKELILKKLFGKAIQQDRISSHEIPFLISLSDEEKYDFLFDVLYKKEELGQKQTLEIVTKCISLMQISTNTSYFMEHFFPVFLRGFTASPGLLPVWCGEIPIGLREVKKPGEMVHYIDFMTIYKQRPVPKKRLSGKLFTLTWGKEELYSHAKEGEDIEWEYFEEYEGTIIFTSERIIPLLSDGTYPFVFLNARITSLHIYTDGVEFTLDGHNRPFLIAGLNDTRDENISFCMSRLVKKGTVVKKMED